MLNVWFLTRPLQIFLFVCLTIVDFLCVRWVRGERWEGRLGSWEARCRWVLWSHEGSIEHRLLWLVFTGSWSWRSGSRSHCFHPVSVALNTIMKMSLDTEYKTYNFSIEYCENVHVRNFRGRVCSENVAQHINNYLSVHWHHPRSHALSSELSKSEWGPRALTPYVISACQQAGGCFEKLTKIGEPVIPEKIHKYSKNPDTVIHSAL